MKIKTKTLIGLAAGNTALLLAIGWLIVNLMCSGDCGGHVQPGVPWGPP